MIGTGCLVLPGGLAATTDYKIGLLPANILLATLGVLSGYTFSLYGRLSHATKAGNLSELWRKVYRKDRSTLVSLSTFLYCFGCALTFSLVIGDALGKVAAGMGLTGILANRQAIILAVTGSMLVPLCNLKSMAALAPVSLIGILGTVVTTLFLGLRYPRLVPNSPYAIPGEGYLAQMPPSMQPLFDTYHRLRSPAPLVLVAMGCVALMAHFSAPEFYQSIAEGTSDDEQGQQQALQGFTRMTVVSYLAVIIINALTLTFGFGTFGGNSQGIVLNNYAPTDVGASVSRLLVAVSVIGGFPLIFSACRTAAMDLFGKDKTSSRPREKRYTAVLLGILTSIAMLIQDAGFVVSFNGALMGTSIIYIFPTLLFLKHTRDHVLTKRLRLERTFNRFLVGFGAVCALFGAGTSVLSYYFPHLLR